MPSELVQIGQRLRAYRLGAGLSIEEVARKLNMSRASAYRMEQAGVNRIDLLERVARLLDVSVASLLGVDIEYIATPVAYYERLRQLEDEMEHGFAALGAVHYPLHSPVYEQAMPGMLRALVPANAVDREQRLATMSAIVDIFRKRKASYQQRRPSITHVVPAADLEHFARYAFGSSPISTHDRRIVEAELRHFAGLLAHPPLGLQVGILFGAFPSTSFYLLRMRNRSALIVSPFRIGARLNIDYGVATITTNAKAIEVHERLANHIWENAVTGKRAADFLLQCISRKPEARAGKAVRTQVSRHEA